MCEQRSSLPLNARRDASERLPKRDEIAMSDPLLLRAEGVRDSAEDTFRLAVVDCSIITTEIAEGATALGAARSRK
jgi:hypothetical protein